MEIVTLKPLFHRGAECIGIYSTQSATLNFQKKAGAKWSKTNKCWYIACTEKDYQLFEKALKGKAILQTDELKKYLLARKRENSGNIKQVLLPVIPPNPGTFDSF